MLQESQSATQLHPHEEAQAIERAARRTKNFALTGIFLSMFVSMISMTVVGTSMPVIMGDLGGTQTSLTWVVTATMLASAVSSPIWGKLADLMNKKHLMQISLILFTVASALAGLATTPEWLIGFRVFQGIGIGGLGALGQIVMADIISPRERGKYMGIMSTVMSGATVGGPLIGGLITDTIGWRWNFFVAVPISIVTIVILHLAIKVPQFKRKVSIDYAGSILIATGFSSILLWVSLVGSQFAWNSVTSLILAVVGVGSLVALIFVERRVKEPVLPLGLFSNRTFTFASIASISVGIGMFSAAIFLGQYFQLARGNTPFESGLLTIPMVAGTLLTSNIAGVLITRTGKWKRFVILGSVITLVGSTLMAFFRTDTPYWFIAGAIFLLGAGVGMTMQNLLLVTQNTAQPEQMGAATSNLTLFRTIGGTAGMAAMGAVVGTQVIAQLRRGFEALGGAGKGLADKLATDTIPTLAELSPAVQRVFEVAYGEAIGMAFLICVPFAVLGLIFTALIPNIPLGTKTTSELLEEKQQAQEAK